MSIPEKQKQIRKRSSQLRSGLSPDVQGLQAFPALPPSSACGCSHSMLYLVRFSGKNQHCLLQQVRSLATFWPFSFEEFCLLVFAYHKQKMTKFILLILLTVRVFHRLLGITFNHLILKVPIIN